MTAAARTDERDVLAELRARTALRRAGLDPHVALTRASSVTNDVWLTPTHAVRVNRTRTNRLAREAALVPSLPMALGYPHIVAHGGGRGEDWLITERVPGEPLAHCWPDLTPDERRTAVHGLARRLAALHRTPAPSDLDQIEGLPQLLGGNGPDATRPVVAQLHEAAGLRFVDAVRLIEAIELVTRAAPALASYDTSRLVHGDVTFENVLWHEGEVTALLDLEWARAGPRDLDLDILLRCAAYPKLHVAAAFEDRTDPADYVDVPRWLAEAYPMLFDVPDLLDRLRVYSIAYDVRDLLAHPPTAEPQHLSPLHPYHRLVKVVDRRSHLDELTL